MFVAILRAFTALMFVAIFGVSMLGAGLGLIPTELGVAGAFVSLFMVWEVTHELR